VIRTALALMGASFAKPLRPSRIAIFAVCGGKANIFDLALLGLYHSIALRRISTPARLVHETLTMEQENANVSARIKEGNIIIE
jgi:hypothetical protein